MNILSGFFTFLIKNFGAILFFYVINIFADFKTAVLASMAFVVCEYIWFKSKKIKPSYFFYFSAFLIIAFGIFDLLMQEPKFFRFEAALINLFSAVFFGSTLLKDKSIVEEFAEAQGRTTASMTGIDKTYFFRFYTIVWTAYFLLKAALYFWLSFNASFNDAFLIRMVVGKVSFWIMMFFSLGLGRTVWKLFAKYKLLPSQRLPKAVPA